MKRIEAIVIGLLAIIACSCSEKLAGSVDGGTMDGLKFDTQGADGAGNDLRDSPGKDARGDAPGDAGVPQADVVALPATCPDDGEWPETDSFEHFKAAVKKVETAGGGTVCLREGDRDWGKVREFYLAGGISLVGAGRDNTTIRWDGGTLLVINEPGHSGQPFRVTGISFVPRAKAQALRIQNVVDFRIDHCYFEAPKTSYVIQVRDRRGQPRSRGVVDHCSFRATGDSVYGVTTGATPWPDEQSRIMNLGTKEAVFIEDCEFEGLGHSTAAFNGGHYVVRHSIFRNPRSTLDAHGPVFVHLAGNDKTQERGTRCVEIYQNTFVWEGERGHTAMRLRGGGGVVFNNTTKNAKRMLTLVMETGSYEEQTCDDGVCKGKDQIHQMWIWNNTNEDVLSELQFEGKDVTQLVVQDEDFFLRAPSLAEDGFTYTPYTYPHPLVSD